MIRAARPDDVPEILAMVGELAEYERAADEVHASEADLHRTLFGPSPAAFCHVADPAGSSGSAGSAGSAGDPDDGGVPVTTGGALAGMALWFLNFSTWQGRHGVYLEDLYVRPSHRGQGYGRALLASLASLCVDRGYGRLQWWVLDWNAGAHAFYRRLGAEPMDAWTVWRLSGDALEDLGRTARHARTGA